MNTKIETRIMVSFVVAVVLGLTLYVGYIVRQHKDIQKMYDARWSIMVELCIDQSDNVSRDLGRCLDEANAAVPESTQAKAGRP